MHKQHPQTAYRKYAISIGTIFENCDKNEKRLLCVCTAAFYHILSVDDQPVIEEGQTKRTGTGVGADDAADLAHQRLGKAEIVHQIGLDGVHLAGADGVTGQRGETGIDAAQLLDLLDRKSTRLNSSHSRRSRMPSSA